MSRITITIDTDNSAFEDNFNLETRMILEKAWEHLVADKNTHSLKDTNGNSVGTVTVMAEPVAGNILSLDIEDIYYLLTDYFDYTDKETDERIKQITQEELDAIAYAMAEWFSMDTYWDALRDSAKDILKLEDKTPADEPA